MPSFLPSSSRTTLLAAWWTQNSVSLSLFFSTFLLSASLLPFLPSIPSFNFYCVVVAWLFFFWGCFFFSSVFLAAKLKCCSVGMTVKIYFNLSGSSIRHNTWVKITWLQQSHMKAENRINKLQIGCKSNSSLTWSVSWVPFQCFYSPKSAQLCSAFLQFTWGRGIAHFWAP